jgi:hypothetical protein
MVLFSDKDEHFHGHPVSTRYTFRVDHANPEMRGWEHYEGMYNHHFNESDIVAMFQNTFIIDEMIETEHPVYAYRRLWNVILRKPIANLNGQTSSS